MDFADPTLRDDLVTMHGVPPPMIEAAQAMLTALAAERRERVDGREGTSVYIASPLSGACRICGVDR